jgi:peroxiredoxin
MAQSVTIYFQKGMPMNESLRKSAMIALLILSACINIALAHKVKSQQMIISDIKTDNRLRAGAIVSAIEGKNPEGELIKVDFAGKNKPTIVYVFTPGCAWCKRNLNNMKMLRQKTAAEYEFIGVSLAANGVAEYVKQHSIDYPVITDISPALRSEYKMGGTPTTLLISNDSRVLKVWTGAYDGALLSEIDRYFNLKLPGLSAE